MAARIARRARISLKDPQRSCQTPAYSGKASPRVSVASLLRLLFEIAIVRRGLVLARRHQIAVRTYKIGLAADDDVLVVLVAIVLGPCRIALPFVAARHRPGPREGVIDQRDFIEQLVGVALVERHSLPDDRLVVLMKWNTAAVHDPRSLEIAGLDHERVEFPLVAYAFPMADRIPCPCRVDRSRPVATVCEDAPQRIQEIEEHKSDVRLNDDFHGFVNQHGARHAGVTAADRGSVAAPAFGTVRHGCIKLCLIFRDERRLLSGIGGLTRVPPIGIEVGPSAGPVRIFPLGRCRHAHRAEERHESDRKNRASIDHDLTPLNGIPMRLLGLRAGIASYPKWLLWSRGCGPPCWLDG